MNASERILVIRLGALGDLVLCFQAFHEIRLAHPGAEIALLTMPAFAGFASLMPWFDVVMTDERAPAWRLDRWYDLAKRVRDFGPRQVYDLQGKFRQSALFGLIGGPWGPDWSGAAPRCSHPRLWPPQEGMHFTEFLSAQLRRAHVPPAAPPSLAWLDAPLTGFPLSKRYALLIPGCAPGRDYKRWPAKFYAGLANGLRKKGIDTIALGTGADGEAIEAIRETAPYVLDFSNKTTLPQVAALARRAVAVIGNDTGLRISPPRPAPPYWL
ncbi:MAG: ADP-heptose--LPS heptosyltransferase [Pseudomonadota bacterium]|nr:ADP-heptose--LPS heptosyltransferase [Pseudomonadota bacterium]